MILFEFMKWNELLGVLFNEYNYNTSRFEKEFGVSNVAIGKILNGKTNRPNPYTKSVIEKAFKIKINDGDPLNVTFTKIPMTQERFGKLLNEASQFKDSLPARDYPLLATVYAGEPAMLEHEYFDEKAVFAYDKQDHSCFALRVSGKSMETTLRDGDIVLVDISIPVIDGCLVVVKLRDGSQLIKRYHSLDDVYIKLTSDNHEYGVKLVKKEDIQVCYRVVSINFFL